MRDVTFPGGRLLAAALVAVAALAGGARAGIAGDVFNSFADRPEYVRPISTILGTASNAGWYQSASIGREFGFYVGLPVSLTYIHSKDRSYEDSYTDGGCETCNDLSGTDCNNCTECVEYTAPTIFGRDPAPQLDTSILDVNGNVIYSIPVYLSDSAVAALADLSLLPFASLQAGFSYFHTELKLRFIGAPTVMGVGVRLPGFGIQHDLASFLPDIPVSISVGANFTFIYVGLEPKEWNLDEAIEGTLELRGLSNFLGAIVGYKLHDRIEVFLEAGWEHATLRSTGEITIEPGTALEDVIKPDMKFSGRNVFRASLNFAFAIGIYPVIGQGVGADFGTNLALLGYRFSKENE
ncbi:MAG: hypothetical protein GF418_02215 [Chitinivibrionales bacterium]|nr:hypothetical protein [Chitinivibrionales bacterium]MBD3394416.1 hypothetical protein [Chitinivibrionales bacterium]